MELNEAIRHERQEAENYTITSNALYEKYYKISLNCQELADYHERLADWLTELQERREADRWIPVSERLPENDEYVLVYDNSDMFVAWFSKEFGWRSFDGNLDEYTPITHWRHLPKAPESEDK